MSDSLIRNKSFQFSLKIIKMLTAKVKTSQLNLTKK